MAKYIIFIGLQWWVKGSHLVFTTYLLSSFVGVTIGVINIFGTTKVSKDFVAALEKAIFDQQRSTKPLQNVLFHLNSSDSSGRLRIGCSFWMCLSVNAKPNAASQGGPLHLLVRWSLPVLLNSLWPSYEDIYQTPYPVSKDNYYYPDNFVVSSRGLFCSTVNDGPNP